MTPTNNDKRLTHFMWIVGIFITLVSGTVLTVSVASASSAGEVKKQVEVNTVDIETLKKTSAPAEYVQAIIDSNQGLCNLIRGIKTEDQNKIDEAMKQWQELQDQITRKYIPTRSSGSNQNTVK